MLANEYLLGAAAGVPIEILFEQRIAGELFDDLVIKTEEGLRWSISNKSNQVVNAGSFDADLVKRAWWQLENPVDEATPDDLLVVAQPSPSHDTASSIEGLVRWSVEQPDGQPAKLIDAQEATSASKRALWESFKLDDLSRNPQEILRKLRFLWLDLDPLLARDLSPVRQIAESVLEEPGKWRELWHELLVIASDSRSLAAGLTTGDIVTKLSPTLPLRAHGDADEDFAKLSSWGLDRAPRTRTIGGRLELPNHPFLEKLEGVLAESRFAFVSGDSGVGKSVALAEWCGTGRAVYVRADTLQEPPVSMHNAGCRRNLDAVLRLSRRRDLVFVVDQVDRVEEDQLWAVLKSWLRILAGDSRVRIVFGCTSTSAAVRAAELSRELSSSLTEVILSRPFPEILSLVREAFPDLAALLKDYAPSPLLATPRALDQLLKIGAKEFPTTVSQFLALIWLNRIQGGSGNPTVRHAAKQLAEAEASLGVGKLQVQADPSTIDFLMKQGVLIDDGESMTWDHDSTGDLIRTQMLVEADKDGTAPTILGQAILNPLWRRALRLYCVSVLEQDAESGFKRVRTLLTAADPSGLLELTLFDALILCHRDLDLPVRVGAILAEDKQTMRRFIARFLFVAAEPAELGKDVNAADGLHFRAIVRIPRWDRWIPTARMVLAQRAWFYRNGPGEGLEVLLPYLEAVAEGKDFLKATRPVLVMSALLKRGPYAWRRNGEEKMDLAHRAVISALTFERESATKLIRRWVGRVERKERERTGREPFEIFRGSIRQVEAWPLGPRSRVDDKFQSFLFTDFRCTLLTRRDPELAKEALYACLIEEPGERLDYSYDRDHFYGITNHLSVPLFPATHQSPFINSFFDHSFELGLEIVATLVEFAVDRWISHYEPGTRPPNFVLAWHDRELQLKGDGQCYFWMYGYGAPYALQSLLLTLERRLLETEDQDELTRRVESVVNTLNNLPILAVLVSTAKANEKLFLKQLSPLLFCEWLDSLDIRTTIEPNMPTVAGLSPRNEWWRNQEEQIRYARLKHRRLMLRNFAPYYLLYGDPAVAERARTRWLQMASEESGDAAHVLKLLAAIYDREALAFEQMPDNQVLISPQLPADLKAAAKVSEEEMALGVREISIVYNVQKVLAGGEASPETADELLDDLARASLREGNPYFESDDIGVWIVCLMAALKGTPSKGGDVQQCRTKLFELIRSKKHSDSRPEHFDDIWHWAGMVAAHAPAVFGGDLAGDARKALVAFVESASGYDVWHAAKELRVTPQGAELAYTILEIARVWAVELVRLAQLRHTSQFDDDIVVSAQDLAYARRADVFVKTGEWSADERLALGRTNADTQMRWRPGAYEHVLMGLLELLETTTEGPRHDQLLVILEDVLEGIRFAEGDDEHHYDQASHQAWNLIGGAISNLQPSAQSLILEKWWAASGSGDENALELPSGLLSAYARGVVTIAAASPPFETLLTPLLNPELTSVRTDVFLRAFGIGWHGISVDMQPSVGEAWIQRHLDLYARMIDEILKSWHGTEELLQRCRRPEFRTLDRVLFDRLIKVANEELITKKGARYLAELLISFAPLAKGDPQLRQDWRRLLVMLERSGERLAWQVLAEIADRV